MALSKQCSVCGLPIYFKRNSEGKYVPFNTFDNQCHFETCTLKPKGQGALASSKFKVSYNEQMKNHKLEDYMR